MARILFADDDAAMRSMVVDLLSAASHSVTAVADGNAAIRAVQADPPDLVLLDYRMGRPNGFEVCRAIKDDISLQHLPVLILTGRGDVEDRIEGFAAGANDFIPKPFDNRELLARVNALLRLSEQGRDLNPTTGLPGGTSIEREFERRLEEKQQFAVCYLDMNDFKSFNDRFGFSTANSVIEALGRHMRQAIAGTQCFAGHVGGDDFVMMAGQTEARALVEELQVRVRDSLVGKVPAEVIASGMFLGRLRNGSDDYIALTRLVAVVMHVEATTAPTLAELGEMAAEAKGRAKLAEGGIVEFDVGPREGSPEAAADQMLVDPLPPSRPIRSSRNR